MPQTCRAKIARGILLGALLVGTILLPAGCSRMPPIEEQQARILNRDLQLDMLTPEAFLATWGKPRYQYEANMQFFPLQNGQHVPRFRVPLGEAPAGWNSTVVFGPSQFFAYPEHGELLGFMDGRLIYREVVSAKDLHALGKAWADEQKFKTTIETDATKPR